MDDDDAHEEVDVLAVFGVDVRDLLVEEGLGEFGDLGGEAVYLDGGELCELLVSGADLL